MFRQLYEPGADALTLYIDGQAVNAGSHESVAAVILRQDFPVTRSTPVQGRLRAPYCMTGVCFECLAVVDGVASIQTCMLPVRQGMDIRRQHGKRSLA